MSSAISSVVRINLMAGLVTILLGCSGGQPDTPAADSQPSIAASSDEDWQRFLAWWPGDYDNFGQLAQIAAEGESSVMPPTALYIRRVELPSFGADVFYAEWHNAENPSDILRQRFYAFERDGDSLRLNLHIFPPDEEFVARTAGAYLDPSKLDGVTVADMFPLPGCDVFFTWDGEVFSGAMKRRSCSFEAPGTNEFIYSWSQMRLRPSVFEYLDGWFRPEDDSVYRQFSDRWIVFEKRSS